MADDAQRSYYAAARVQRRTNTMMFVIQQYANISTAYITRSDLDLVSRIDAPNHGVPGATVPEEPE